jgi:hypothetical protein
MYYCVGLKPETIVLSFNLINTTECSQKKNRKKKKNLETCLSDILFTVWPAVG